MSGLEVSELLGTMCLMYEVSKLFAGVFWRMRSVLLVVCTPDGLKFLYFWVGLCPRV